MTQMRLSDVMRDYECGDLGPLVDEFEWIRQNHQPKVRRLSASVLRLGIQKPILLGPDGRIWDGHHRLYVAYYLGFEYVPVEHAR